LNYFGKIACYCLVGIIISNIHCLAEILPDIYENDNDYINAKVIFINNPDAQDHNFHEKKDVDWVKFYGLKSKKYTISVMNPGINCNPAIDLYFLQGNNLILVGDTQNVGLEGDDEEKVFQCEKNAVYYVKIWTDFSMVPGENTSYCIVVTDASAAFDFTIKGIIIDRYSGNVINGVTITTTTYNSAITDELGQYRLFKCSEKEVLNVKRDGFLNFTTSVVASELEIVHKDLQLIPDIDSDHQIGLSDVILILNHICHSDLNTSNDSPLSLKDLIEFFTILIKGESHEYH